MTRGSQRGFSLIEALVGMVVGTLVLAGAYSLWRTHQEQSLALNRKSTARDELALASKRLQREVTLAGLGLGGAANLAMSHAAGTDTLTVFMNPQELRTSLSSDVAAGDASIHVDDATPFLPGGWVALAAGGHGEIRRIVQVTGNVLQLDAPLAGAYPVAGGLAYPAERQRFWSDPDSAQFIREAAGEAHAVARMLKDFRVAFLDQDGTETANLADVRTVRFSLTAVFPAREGALNSIVLSSTAIPRNML